MLQCLSLSSHCLVVSLSIWLFCMCLIEKFCIYLRKENWSVIFFIVSLCCLDIKTTKELGNPPSIPILRDNLRSIAINYLKVLKNLHIDSIYSRALVGERRIIYWLYCTRRYVSV